MARMRKRLLAVFIPLLLLVYCVASQTTTALSSTTANTPELTTPTTTFVPTLTPFFTTEATTFATADSSLPTTTVPTEEGTVETTTGGQTTNGAGRTNGFKLDFQRNRPSSNQENLPEKEAQTEKPEEKNIAWKFVRGGNNQESRSAHPGPISGYPLWKKEASKDNGGGESEQKTDATAKKKPKDQAYIVWSVGQGNQPNSWALGTSDSPWIPAGVVPADGGWDAADATNGGATGEASWNAGGWSADQPSDNGNSQQDGWTDEDAAPEDGTDAGWDNGEQEEWNSQNDNAGGWTNQPSEETPANGQAQNTWTPQGNGRGGRGRIATQQSGNARNRWVAPQKDGGWSLQPQTDENQGGPEVWNDNNDGWNGPPDSLANNNNGEEDNAGWNNGQPNSGTWNDGAKAGQNGNMAWKVYNEDTQTMENIDESSEWKVIGDGGSDGWKLVNDNGNVEWKIENINGEWKVTSADEISETNNATSPSQGGSANATIDTTNTTSSEIEAKPNPTGGWDDDKQGRYIIWKFSENGKGEARVYDGDGTEPEVWTVGDNNEWWKETVGVKEADTVVQGENGNWQGNSGWQNTAPQKDKTWQNNGNRQPQGAGWQSGSGSKGRNWQQNSSPQNGAGNWQNKPVSQAGGKGWQKGGIPRQRGGNRWQQKGRTGNQNKRNNGAWRNPNAKKSSWSVGNTGSRPPNAWRNSGRKSQPPSQQSGWQNPTPQISPNPQNSGTRKGKWRNNGNKSGGRWASNNGGRKYAPPPERVWNKNNSWRTNKPSANEGQGNGGWVNNPSPPNRVPDNAGGGTYQNGGKKSVQRGRWAGNGGGGKTMPYIIVIKSPDTGSIAPASNSWKNTPNGVISETSKNGKGNKPQNNRRSNGWKMNRAGSSGWQWNPQGGKEGWQWRDGWMGSGGGFGGWMGDKGTMYSSWRPTKPNGAQSRKSTGQRIGVSKGNKKSASKMVFVFGTKKNSGNTRTQPTNKGSKKGKQVIIIDYTTAGAKVPKGEESMKKDIESVIQALKTAKPTGVRRTPVWKHPTQEAKSDNKKVQSQRWAR